MEIKILGPGCAKCRMLDLRVKEIIEKYNIDNVIISKIEDYSEIIKYGIMATPALVFNENVEIKGRMATKEEIKILLYKYAE